MSLNRPLFVAALVALALAFLGEIGVGIWAVRPRPVAPKDAASAVDAPLTPKDFDAVHVGDPDEGKRPGKGIPALALLDGLLLLAVGMMGLALVLPQNIVGRVHGIVSLVVSLVVLLGSILLILETLALVFVMIGLFLAVPFGTIAYLAIWGSFDRGGAAATLGTLLFLKLAFGVLLLLANPRFVETRKLVILALTSLLANVVVSLLHGFPPGVLVSITDAIAAIVVAVLALIWAVILLVGAIISVVKLLRLSRGSAVATPG
jgi:hypothetical protein